MFFFLIGAFGLLGSAEPVLSSCSLLLVGSCKSQLLHGCCVPQLVADSGEAIKSFPGMPCSNCANTFIQKTIYLLTEEANWLSYLILSLPNVSDDQILSLNNILS